MSLHTEIHFKTEICGHLVNNCWLYTDKDSAGFVRGLCLYPADVLAWVQETYPEAWESLQKNHRAAAADTLLNRLRHAQGTLHVLRHGSDVLGLRKDVRMAQFKPANAMNTDIMARYSANRLRVVRQVQYSMYNENSIDLSCS